MSWKLDGEVNTSQGNWDERIWDTEVDKANDPDASNEQDQQICWAKECLIDAIDSHVVGSPGATYVFSATGHANPENKPRKGYVNDVVTITISFTDK